jgi:predicted ribosomally synthesized peptide with nif11-like leader
MSEEELLALVARLKSDRPFREKLRSVPNSMDFAEIVKEAGYDVSHEQWLNYLATNSMAISDEELEGISGGTDVSWGQPGKCYDYSEVRMANTQCDW